MGKPTKAEFILKIKSIEYMFIYQNGVDLTIYFWRDEDYSYRREEYYYDDFINWKTNIN